MSSRARNWLIISGFNISIGRTNDSPTMSDTNQTTTTIPVGVGGPAKNSDGRDPTDEEDKKRFNY